MKKFIMKVNDQTDSPCVVLVGMYVMFMSVACIVFTLFYLAPDVQLAPSTYSDWVFAGAAFSTLIPLILISILAMLDGIIRHTSNEITNGDHVIEHFFFKHLFEYDEYVCGRKREFNYLQVGLFVGVMVSVGFLFTVTALSYPWLFIFPVGWGIYIALVKLGKFVYNVSRSLERHKTDPNAHKKQ